MTPLDDELRRTLLARAGTVAPSPDPLAGIESRARGIRRRRTAFSMAGVAAAIAAVALAVPAVISEPSPARPPQFASAAPSASAHPAVLDPARPWAFRGTPVDARSLDTFTREWQVQHPGGTLTPLWAQVNESTRQVEMVFVGTGESEHWIGWTAGSASGPEFDQVEVVKAPTSAYQFAAPGDEGVMRLFVVAAPDSSVTWAKDGVTFAPMTEVADGVGVTVLTGNTSSARVRVTASDGTVVYEADARGTSAPATNLLDWPSRGDASVGPSVRDLEVAFSRAHGRADGSAVDYQPLFTGDTDSGVRYTMGQAWFEGETKAYTVAYTTGGTNGPEFFLGPVTPSQPVLLAFLVGRLPGASVDFLVVVPQPGTGQVLYDDNATGSFRPVTGQDHLDGVVIIDRAKDATSDRLEVLDGNGDLDHPMYRGSVTPLLCGLKECG